MNIFIVSGTRDLQNYGLFKGNKYMNPTKANLLVILGQFTVGGLQWLLLLYIFCHDHCGNSCIAN